MDGKSGLKLIPTGKLLILVKTGLDGTQSKARIENIFHLKNFSR